MPTPFERAIQRAFQREPRSLADHDGPETIAEWDSHAHLEFLSELEDAYQVTFTVDEQLELATLGAVKEALRKRGVTL
jgi:acyl carrier protein